MKDLAWTTEHLILLEAGIHLWGASEDRTPTTQGLKHILLLLQLDPTELFYFLSLFLQLEEGICMFVNCIITATYHAYYLLVI